MKLLILRRVVGHSMVPALPPGTLVFGIGIYFGEFKPGQIVIIDHDGKEKIKRIDKIEDNKIFVLGDHLDTSIDSRQFGWLPFEAIKALVIWPRKT